MEIFLETDRLVLRRFTEGDVENEVLPAFLDYHEHSAGCGFWAAIEKSTERFVGWFHLRPADAAPPGEVELGYRLRRSEWGKGYATEGSRALVHVGFAELGAGRIVASAMVVNVASRRVMEKAGLKFVRVFHQPWPYTIEGEEEGDVEFALLRSEWDQRPSKTDR